MHLNSSDYSLLDSAKTLVQTSKRLMSDPSKWTVTNPLRVKFRRFLVPSVWTLDDSSNFFAIMSIPCEHTSPKLSSVPECSRQAPECQQLKLEMFLTSLYQDGLEAFREESE